MAKHVNHINNQELGRRVNDNLKCELFDNHCQEVADQLEIDKEVVKSVLKSYAFFVLMILIKRISYGTTVKINIFGWFSLSSTKDLKFKFKKLKL